MISCKNETKSTFEMAIPSNLIARESIAFVQKQQMNRRRKKSIESPYMVLYVIYDASKPNHTAPLPSQCNSELSN